MQGFLEGYRVLDLTDEKGHLCGRILGDMGADVIKVEPPGGEPSRNIGPFYHDEPHPEKSLPWSYSNANKRGVTLNLETPEGREIFKEMVKQSDIVVESFRPGYLAELGLDYDSLAAIKPDIILTSITPFGQSGPRAQYKVTDLVAISMGGMAYVFGDEDRAPVRISQPQAYFLGGQHAAAGTLFALYNRDLTGEGDWVDVSIQEAIIFTLTYHLPLWDDRQLTRKRNGPYTSYPRPLLQDMLHIRWMFPCKDGEVCLAFQGGNRAAAKSSHAIVDWANEEGYAQKIKDYNFYQWDSRTIPQSEQDLLASEIAPFLLTKTKEELLEVASKRRILLAPVSTVVDLTRNPQFDHRDFWRRVPHPELNDTIIYPGPFVKVDACPQGIYRRAPTIGEHNQEIYEGEMGISKERLTLLKAQGVI